MAGEEAIVPTARAMGVVASAARTGVAVLRVLDAATRELVETVLKACAEQARSKVLIDQMDGRSPTQRQCNEKVEDPESSRLISRAMLLGCLMHKEALVCTREALDKRLPGNFSLEQRYRYDPVSGALSLVSKEEVRALLRMRCGDELTGTLVPDVVIHSGDPLQPQAVYDFKFPCVNSDSPPSSRKYPPGHPYENETQERVYEEALKTRVRRIVPRLGIIP
jgi:hypothetical protein